MADKPEKKNKRASFLLDFFKVSFIKCCLWVEASVVLLSVPVDFLIHGFFHCCFGKSMILGLSVHILSKPSVVYERGYNDVRPTDRPV